MSGKVISSSRKPQLSQQLEWSCCGQSFILLPQRAILHPATGILAVADLHLGKAAHFQAHGMAVPDDGGSYDLQRLSTLVKQMAARQLWLLGDLCHYPKNLTAETLTAWQHFVAQHDDIEIRLVAGNHDRNLPEPFSSMLALSGVLTEAALCGSHLPLTTLQTGKINLCGHLHPVVRHNRNGMTIRKPAFLLRDRTIVLPAFGSFTGGYEVKHLNPGERAALAGDDFVLLL